MNARLLALAERCEKATGPDRELDGMIAVRLYPEDRAVCHVFAGRMSRFAQWVDGVPHYTRSLDSAMSLVPEGWFWRVGHSTLYQGWAATNRVHPDHCEREDETFGNAATPALALCAAALRARAAQGNPQ